MRRRSRPLECASSCRWSSAITSCTEESAAQHAESQYSVVSCVPGDRNWDLRLRGELAMAAKEETAVKEEKAMGAQRPVKKHGRVMWRPSRARQAGR